MLVTQIKTDVINRLTNYIEVDCNGASGCIYNGGLYHLDIREGKLHIRKEPATNFRLKDLVGIAEALT